MRRCPVHDTVHEEGEPCPNLGKPTDQSPDGDCEMHRVPKLHEKKRVLADGGKWDEKLQQAVRTT